MARKFEAADRGERAVETRPVAHIPGREPQMRKSQQIAALTTKVDELQREINRLDYIRQARTKYDWEVGDRVKAQVSLELQRMHQEAMNDGWSFTFPLDRLYAAAERAI